MIQSSSEAQSDDSDIEGQGQDGASLEVLGQTSEEMIQALSDPDPNVRRKAAANLGRLAQASPKTVQALLSALDDHEADVRRSVVESLGLFAQSSPKIMRALISVLSDPDSDVRSRAATSLRRIEHIPSELIPLLVQSLHNTNYPSTSRDVASLLGELAPESQTIVHALLREFCKESSAVRSACTQALVLLGKRFPLIIPEIETKLLDAIHNVQYDKIDDSGRSGHDYAYDGLWLLVVGDEPERA